MSNATVNDVITDSVSQTNTLLTSIAAPQGCALVDVASAETIGMTMYNAVSAQQNAQLTTNASVTAACARMLAAVPKSPHKPPSKATSPPPFMPLSPAAKGDNSTVETKQLLAMANALASNAAEDVSSQSKANRDTQAELSELIKKLQALQIPGDTATANHGKGSDNNGNGADGATT